MHTRTKDAKDSNTETLVQGEESKQEKKQSNIEHQSEDEKQASKPKVTMDLIKQLGLMKDKK
jgi:hypothetical protein